MTDQLDIAIQDYAARLDQHIACHDRPRQVDRFETPDGQGSTVRLHARHATRRRIAPIAAAAVLVAGAAAALATILVRSDATTPANPAPSVPAADVPAPLAPATGSMVYPIVNLPPTPEDYASYSREGSDGSVSVSSALAERNGDTYSGTLVVTASNRPADTTTLALTYDMSQAQTVTIHGTAILLLTTIGGSQTHTAVLPGTPVVTVTGVDPVSFLEKALPNAVTTAPVTNPEPGHPDFTIVYGELPNGYVVIRRPFEVSSGNIEPYTAIGGTDTADGSTVWMSLYDPAPAFAMANTMTPVDINGKQGWLEDGPGKYLSWEPVPGVFALVGGNKSAEQSLLIARNTTFVDEATWKQHYSVDVITMPPANSTR